MEQECSDPLELLPSECTGDSVWEPVQDLSLEPDCDEPELLKPDTFPDPEPEPEPELEDELDLETCKQ